MIIVKFFALILISNYIKLVINYQFYHSFYLGEKDGPIKIYPRQKMVAIQLPLILF